MQKSFFSCKWSLLFVWLCLGLVACQQDNALSDTEDEVTGQTGSKKQWVQFYIGDVADTVGQTRALPPDVDNGEVIVGTCQVNEVALMVFRRQQGSADPFLFDVANSTVLDADGKITGERALTEVTDVPESDKNLKMAQGSFQKEEGYEYRIFALGYNTKRQDMHPASQKQFDERDEFRVVDQNGKALSASTSWDNVKLQLVKRNFSDLSAGITGGKENNITGYWVRTPEIFYGTCTAASGLETITYEEDQVTGTLYRGVARVTINISEFDKILENDYVSAFSLMLDMLPTEVSLDSYDSFRTPQAPVLQPLPGFGSDADAVNYKTFTAVTGEEACAQGDKQITLDFFVLPTITQMSVRYQGAASADIHESYVSVTSLSDGNQATGIIDPSAGGKKFYFRRNQKYVINGKGSEIAANEE